MSLNALARNSRSHLIVGQKSSLSDAEEANRLFAYDPDTGAFVRRITVGMRAKAGSNPGYLRNGYWTIRFRGKPVAAHRLAWLFVNGEWPKNCIDHINGNRSDNRICNLRDVDGSTNLENQRNARADNALRVLGVRKKRSNRFEARIWVKGHAKQLGTFDTPDEAHQAYLEAKRALHVGCTI